MTRAMMPGSARVTGPTVRRITAVVLQVVLRVALTGIVACGEKPDGSAGDAARADSSAAGYAVGTRADGGAIRDTMHQVIAGALPDARPPMLPGRGTGATPVAPVGRSARPGKGMPAVGARPALVPNGKPAPADSATIAVPAGPVPTGPVPAGPVRVNEFLAYDARSRTVSLQLIAGYNGLNGSLNYNGATNGTHGIVVPLGWRIHVAVMNHDSDLQHSAIVVREVLPPPIEPSTPAFDGAVLPGLDEGLHEDETGTLDFVAGHAGRFMIACGVAGHAQAGMWLQLSVTTDAIAPSYR